MGRLFNAIKEFTDKTTGPWIITMWTLPANGKRPEEYTAGYFSLVADQVAFQGEDIVKFLRGDGNEGQFLLVVGGADEVNVFEDGALEFPYLNLGVNSEEFVECPYFALRAMPKI